MRRLNGWLATLRVQQQQQPHNSLVLHKTINIRSENTFMFRTCSGGDAVDETYCNVSIVFRAFRISSVELFSCRCLIIANCFTLKVYWPSQIGSELHRFSIKEAIHRNALMLNKFRAVIAFGGAGSKVFQIDSRNMAQMKSN